MKVEIRLKDKLKAVIDNAHKIDIIEGMYVVYNLEGNERAMYPIINVLEIIEIDESISRDKTLTK